MPKNLLPVPHRQQTEEADCLPICVAMVLEYFGHSPNYAKLYKLLNATPYGTPARNVQRLTALGCDVVYSSSTLEGIAEYLTAGIPIIIFLRTSELPYWKIATNHAVVVVGLDEEFIYLNDPAFPTAPQHVSHLEFLLSWLEFDYTYAVITC